LTYSQFWFSGASALKTLPNPFPIPGLSDNDLILNNIFPEQKVIKLSFGQAERGLSSRGQELSTDLSTGSVDKMNFSRQ
jgi:hypothetical protein